MSKPAKATDMPPHIYFIRHGETEWTFSGQHTSRTDIPLTAQGEDEVREWGNRLCRIPFAHVLTSPLLRAQNTCELVGLAKDAVLEPDLKEWDYGDYEGCPKGESPREISARAGRLIARLRTLEGNIALFSHGQFGSVLAARWIGLSVAEARHFPLGTASLSILCNDPHHPAVPVLELWNAAPHEATRRAPVSRAVDHMSVKQRALQRWENEGGEIPTVSGEMPAPEPGGKRVH